MLCLIGDVCLALSGDKIFQVGLVVFLLGHVLYISDISVARDRFIKMNIAAGLSVCLGIIWANSCWLFQRAFEDEGGKFLTFPETNRTFRGAASQMATQATAKRTMATTKAKR